MHRVVCFLVHFFLQIPYIISTFLLFIILFGLKNAHPIDNIDVTDIRLCVDEDHSEITTEHEGEFE